MALLVFFSTVSFTVEKHFCGDHLVDVAIFSEAEKCGDNMEQTSMKSCCKDEVEVFKGQDELIVKTIDDLEFNDVQFIVSYVYSYINLFDSLPKQIIPFKDYIPPNLVNDIHVLDQVFLI